MPKAASTLSAGPSTPPSSISKTPVAVHNSSIPTTFFTNRKYRSYSDKVKKALDCTSTWTGLVQETQQCRAMFEKSRAAQSATGPRLRQREADLLREVRHKNHDRARFDALVLRNRTNLESLRIQNIRRPANQSRLAQRSCATESISFTTESDRKS